MRRSRETLATRVEDEVQSLALADKLACLAARKEKGRADNGTPFRKPGG
ncbi:hypothetical protein [Litorisediminicola beolgyonensis]|uniref:Uncharacterized protein n=1 Tax=Litorisediminicola beolgyonensis TaxID=1173614 RepID=A0ABW3ZFG2_9RHOB